MSFPAEPLDALRRYTEGNASPEDRAVLDTQLRTDPRFRTYFLQYLNIDSALRDAAAAGPVANPVKILRPPLSVWKWAAGALAAAAALVVGAWISGALPFGGQSAEIVSASQAGPDWIPGQRVPLGDIVLKTGSVRLQLANGVQLDLEAPMQAHFESAMRLRLSRGQLSADVGEHGKGFTVVTDAGEVVDYGTRFGVEAAEDGSAQVAVFSGSVGLRNTSDIAANLVPMTLTEGDAVALHRSKKTKRLQSVRLSANRSGFGQPASSSDLVADVSDNMATPGFNRFYGVVSHGMADGAPAYTDNNRLHWRALPGKEFPQELVGADTLRTFQSTRHRDSFQLQFKVTHPAIVYLVWDSRVPAPEWLQAQYAPTPLEIQCGQWKTRNRKPKAVDLPQNSDGFLTFSVWKRQATAQETLHFGPMPRSDRAMYAVALKSID